MRFQWIKTLLKYVAKKKKLLKYPNYDLWWSMIYDNYDEAQGLLTIYEIKSCI